MCHSPLYLHLPFVAFSKMDYRYKLSILTNWKCEFLTSRLVCQYTGTTETQDQQQDNKTLKFMFVFINKMQPSLKMFVVVCMLKLILIDVAFH